MSDQELLDLQARHGMAWTMGMPSNHELYKVGAAATQALLDLALAMDARSAASKRGHLALGRRALLDAIGRIDDLMRVSRSPRARTRRPDEPAPAKTRAPRRAAAR